MFWLVLFLKDTYCIFSLSFLWALFSFFIDDFFYYFLYSEQFVGFLTPPYFKDLFLLSFLFLLTTSYINICSVKTKR